MGLDYYRKALLPNGTEHCRRRSAPLDSLAADVVDTTLDPSRERLADGSLEPLALLSERRDATVLLGASHACAPAGSRSGRTGGRAWRPSAPISAGLLWDSARMGADPEDLTERMHASVWAHLDQYRYFKARQLCTALGGYVRTGLPGFDIGADPTACDADAAIDWRLDSEPGGARLIVEVALVWT